MSSQQHRPVRFDLGRPVSLRLSHTHSRYAPCSFARSSFSGLSIDLFRDVASQIGWIETAEPTETTEGVANDTTSAPTYFFRCMGVETGTALKEHLVPEDGDCDIFVAWTTISEDRTRLGVEWAIPYYSGSVAILTQSTPTMEQGWAFFNPFTWDLWVAMGVTAIVLPIIVRFDLARRALACPVCLSLSHTHSLARATRLAPPDLRARNPRDPPPNRGTGSGKRLLRVALEDALGVDPRRDVRREYDSCSARHRHLCVLRADIEFVVHCQPGRVPHDAELWRCQEHLRSPWERCEHCRGVSRRARGAIPAAAQHRRHQQPGRGKDGGREDPGRRPFGRGHRYSRRGIHRRRSVRSRLPVAIAAGHVRTLSIAVGG